MKATMKPGNMGRAVAVPVSFRPNYALVAARGGGSAAVPWTRTRTGPRTGPRSGARSGAPATASAPHITQFKSFAPLAAPIDPERQAKQANLGKLVDVLQAQIPDILTTLIPSEHIASDIVLRICPTTHDKIPAFKGYVAYVTTAKTLQLCLTQFVLNPKVKVHVRNTKVLQAGEPSRYGMLQKSAKIIMKWKTCAQNCPHLVADGETARGSRGTHKWSKLDHSSAQSSSNYGLINLELTDDNIERILHGIFIFELDETNQKIQVITIEDVDIVENKQWVETTGSPAC